MRRQKQTKDSLGLQKAPTGLEGFDEISGGGLPRSRTTRLPLAREDWLASQAFLDELNLAFHRLVAVKLRQNPSAVLQIARDNLNRWLHSDSFSGGERGALLEWAEFLAQAAPETICQAITQATEEGQRLRSSSPFVGVLSEEERKEIWRACAEDRPV